jgi:hypothetical protein
MRKRYGFTSSEALGRVSHELLGTGFPQTLKTIQAVLVDRGSWSGCLIHHRADGVAVMTVNHWHVHRDMNGQAAVITEVHSGNVPPGTAAGVRLLRDLATGLRNKA